MNNDVLDRAVNRRTLVSGIFALSVMSLMPSFVAAEGGLKGDNASGTDTETDTGIDDQLAEIGVTGDGAYESPTFGYALEWDRTWTVLAADPGESSAADEWDMFRLEWADMAGDDVTMLEFNGFAAPPANFESWLEGMTDPETLSEFFGGGVREVEVALVERDGDIMEVVWALGATPGENDAVKMLSSYRVLEEGLMLMTTLAIADPDLVFAVAADLIDGVTVNGEPLLLLTLDAIEDAFAALD